jgi:hypothetical protein
MKRLRVALAALLLAALPGSARGRDACADCRYPGALEALFPAARALGPAWETVEEAPEDSAGDPDLVSAGVTAIHALHYTRQVTGGARVCSGEIWAFGSTAQARHASAGNERAGWRIAVLGNLWVMVRGVRFQRGRSLDPGLLPECHRLADLLEANAREALEATRTR